MPATEVYSLLLLCVFIYVCLEKLQVFHSLTKQINTNVVAVAEYQIF